MSVVEDIKKQFGIEKPNPREDAQARQAVKKLVRAILINKFGGKIMEDWELQELDEEIDRDIVKNARLNARLQQRAGNEFFNNSWQQALQKHGITQEEYAQNVMKAPDLVMKQVQEGMDNVVSTVKKARDRDAQGRFKSTKRQAPSQSVSRGGDRSAEDVLKDMFPDDDPMFKIR